MKCFWFAKAVFMFGLSVLVNTAEAASPPYVPLTLLQKVKETELIVIARVGRLKYMRHSNYPDPYETWEVSEIPAEGFRPYVNLLEVKVLRAKPPGNDTQRANEKLELPLWVQLGRCFPATDGASSYPPMGEERVFFLSRKLLRSANSLHLSNCRFESVARDELLEIQDAIKKSSFEMK